MRWRQLLARPARSSLAIMSASTPITTPSRPWRNSFAARRAGARQIQGTLNGLGERCGNANLVSIIPTLKPQAVVLLDKFDIGVSDGSFRSTVLPMSHTRSTKCSIARRTGMRPMSAKARSLPKPASTRRRFSRNPQLTSMSRRNASATGARSWFPINRAAPTCLRNSIASDLPSTRTIHA